MRWILLTLQLGALVTFLPGFGASQSRDVRLAEFPPTSGRQTMYILRIIDGDTLEAAYLVPVRIRIAGINAPELRAPGGTEARTALALMLQPGLVYHADLQGRDKYGRVLADFRDRDGNWVSVNLVGAGHARPWDGRGKRPE